MFERTLKEVTSNTSKFYAYEFRAYIKRVIEEQRYQWYPLSYKYLDWKKTTGLDQRTFIATGEYVDSIKVFKFYNKAKDSIGYVVGLPHKKHTMSNLYLDDLAKVLEYGTKTMPARPHWRPAIALFIKAKGGAKGELRQTAAGVVPGLMEMFMD